LPVAGHGGGVGGVGGYGRNGGVALRAVGCWSRVFWFWGGGRCHGGVGALPRGLFAESGGSGGSFLFGGGMPRRWENYFPLFGGFGNGHKPRLRFVFFAFFSLGDGCGRGKRTRRRCNGARLRLRTPCSCRFEKGEKKPLVATAGAPVGFRKEAERGTPQIFLPQFYPGGMRRARGRVHQNLPAMFVVDKRWDELNCPGES